MAKRTSAPVRKVTGQGMSNRVKGSAGNNGAKSNVGAMMSGRDGVHSRSGPATAARVKGGASVTTGGTTVRSGATGGTFPSNKRGGSRKGVGPVTMG